MTDVYQFCVTGSHLKVTEVEDVAMGSNKIGGSGGSVIQCIISDFIVNKIYIVHVYHDQVIIWVQSLWCYCTSGARAIKLGRGIYSGKVRVRSKVSSPKFYCPGARYAVNMQIQKSYMYRYKIVCKIYVKPGLTNNMKRYFCFIWASDIPSWTGVITWRTYNGRCK